MLQVFSADQIPWDREAGRHRGGTIETKCLLSGRPQDPDNFAMMLARQHAGFHSPRHRHGFDQVRLILEGEMDNGPQKIQKAGIVGYFPEGIEYSQSSLAESVGLTIQFGGPSGNGYVSPEQLKAGYAALAGRGTFLSGTYHYRDELGRERTQDGYEAVVEAVTGRKVSYSKPRYDDIILMDAESFAWLPVAAQPGVEERQLAELTERAVRIAFLRMSSGARYVFPGGRGAQLCFVLQGRGRAGGFPWAAETGIWAPPGDELALTAEADAVLFTLRLPYFASTPLTRAS